MTWRDGAENREVEFELGTEQFNVADLAVLSDEELALAMLRGLASLGSTEWSVPSVASRAEVSSRRESSSRSRPQRQLISAILADALAWLISRALVGPASKQSGSAGEWRVTTLGHAAVESNSLVQVEARLRLQELHPLLSHSATPNFERGDYETAVFAAMKAVEVRLREVSGLGDGHYGDGLATQALKAGGPVDVMPGALPAEVEAYMFLFKGALGAFKNPTSHRIVEYDDPREAADILHFADLLLRVLDRATRHDRETGTQ